MKPKFVFSVLTAAALVTGCASAKQALLLDAVGPVTESSAKTSSAGILNVFSAYDVHADFDNIPYHRTHTDYKIFNDAGQLLQQVHNSASSVFNDPVPVTLAPGRYKVVARANGYGEVTVPVVIERNRVTTLHLEGGYAWPNAKSLSPADTVTLPHGEIIGMRAGSSPTMNSQARR